MVNYTFHLPKRVTEPVPGYAKDAGKNPQMTDRKEKNVIPVSTAEYSSSRWRAWLDNTTITLGMNNVLDQDPPFVKGTPWAWLVPKTATTRGRPISGDASGTWR